MRKNKIKNITLDGTKVSISKDTKCKCCFSSIKLFKSLFLLREDGAKAPFPRHFDGAKAPFPVHYHEITMPFPVRGGFSMIELIFVIVIIAILAGAATMIMPDNRLYSDTNFIIQKIKQTQNSALLYDHFDFNSDAWRSKEYNDTCLKLDKNSFISTEKATNTPKHYKLSPQTSLSSSVQKICFDNLGRPYKNNYLLNNFLNQPIELNITYKQKTKKLDILPYSGMVMIRK